MLDIKAAVRLLVDEGFRISENNCNYIDFDGEENGKKVWVVASRNQQQDFFSLEEAVDNFMETCGYVEK
jgi:hypothetical protein